MGYIFGCSGNCFGFMD